MKSFLKNVSFYNKLKSRQGTRRNTPSGADLNALLPENVLKNAANNVDSGPGHGTCILAQQKLLSRYFSDPPWPLRDLSLAPSAQAALSCCALQGFAQHRSPALDRPSTPISQQGFSPSSSHHQCTLCNQQCCCSTESENRFVQKRPLTSSPTIKPMLSTPPLNHRITESQAGWGRRDLWR